MMSRRSFVRNSSLLAAAPVALEMDRAQVRRVQPFPIETRLSKIGVPGRVVTAIYRRWAPGESRRCRLCPRCTAWADACLVTVTVDVAPAQASLFDASGFPERSHP